MITSASNRADSKTPPRNRHRLFGAVLAIPIVLAASLYLQATIAYSSDDSIVYLRKVVRADYQNTVESLSSIKISNSLSRTTQVQKNDSLSGIISRHYGVGKSNAPAAYASLESAIASANGLSSPNRLRADSAIKIPDLPHITLSSPNIHNPYNQIPRITIRCVVEATSNSQMTPLCHYLDAFQPNRTPAGESEASTYVFDDLRKAAATTIQIVATTMRDAITRVSADGAEYEVESAPMRIAFTQNASLTGNASPAYAATDRATIAKALAAQQHRSPLLIIFDDSWPDDASFVDARNFFVKAITSIRASKKMGAPPFSDAILGAKSAPFVNAKSKDDQNASVQKSHALKVQRALSTFTSLDGADKRVKIIYLPVARSQKFATEILENLVALNLLAKTLGPTLDNPIAGVPADVQASSLAEAKTFVARTASTLGSTVDTDQSVVESVLTFARLYANFPSIPVFVSMSWTVPNQQLPVVMPADAYGLNVVAAGNECPGGTCHITVFDLKRQFAYRSLTPPGDVLAVMDLSDAGAPVCNSSLLKATNDVVGLGYDGYLSETECGTSFSAPRVAWLISLKEAVTDAADNVEDWKSALHHDLTEGMHDASAQNFNKLRLHPERLFKDFIQP
jgi:hypothetical protein